MPQNRAQRRAEKRQKDKKHKPPVSYPGQPVSRSEGFYPQAVPAAQMVERVDKAARRKQLLDELAALENGLTSCWTGCPARGQAGPSTGISGL